MAEKSDYSLFINFFLNSLKKIGLFINFWPSLFTIFFAHYSIFIIKKGPLFTNHYTPSRPSSRFSCSMLCSMSCQCLVVPCVVPGFLVPSCCSIRCSMSSCCSMPCSWFLVPGFLTKYLRMTGGRTNGWVKKYDIKSENGIVFAQARY